MRPEVVPGLLVALALQAFGSKKAMRIEEQIGDESTKNQETKTYKKSGCQHNSIHDTPAFKHRTGIVERRLCIDVLCTRIGKHPSIDNKRQEQQNLQSF